MTFIYLEMPKFVKPLDQVKTRFDKWLYVLRNLERLHNIPPKFQDRIFKKLFAAAEIARFTPEEVRLYEDSLKVYRDIKNSIDTARDEGRIEGLIETALKMLKDGFSVEMIGKYTGLSQEELATLAAQPGKYSVSEPPHAYNARKKSPVQRKKK